MPKDSTPRSLAFLILKSPGNCAPTRAKGTLIPARALGAPHTTWHTPSGLPATWQLRSLSASGWGSTDKISPTTTPSKRPATASIPSTSRLALVSCTTHHFAHTFGIARHLANSQCVRIRVGLNGQNLAHHDTVKAARDGFDSVHYHACHGELRHQFIGAQLGINPFAQPGFA